MIFQLFYKSTSTIGITQSDLDSIILTSIEKNSSLNITGCLVYFKNEFYQILEGEKDEVLSLYENIKKDKRHFHVTLLNQELTKYRIFSNWNMAMYYIDENRSPESIVNVFKNKILLLDSLNFYSDTALEFWFDIRKRISQDKTIGLSFTA